MQRLAPSGCPFSRGGRSGLAEEPALGGDRLLIGGAVDGPLLGREWVEAVEPAVLEADVLATVEEEPAPVGVAAVGGGARRGQTPDLAP